MNDQFDFFGQATAPEAAPSSALQPVKVKPSAAELTPAQHRFNKLISRLDKLHQQMQDFDRVVQRHRMPYLQAVGTIHQRLDQCRREILLCLHERRQGKGLTASEKKFSLELIKRLLDTLQFTGDAELQAVFNFCYPPEEQAKEAEEEALAQEALRAMMQDLAGQYVPGLDAATSPEEMMAAVRAHLVHEDEKRHAKREAKRAKKAPTARQQQVLQSQQDAHTTLRSIFRQLASALHPDREPDTAKRERKTELMAQANTAYERRDLNMLLRLQMQVAQIDEQSMAKLTDEKLAAMSILLKEQVATVEKSLAKAEMEASHEFGFPVSSSQSEASLLSLIGRERHSLEGLLDAAQVDLIRVRNNAELKRWLKEQKIHFKHSARQELQMDGLMDGFFY
jgi:hypothetical protein